MFSTNYRCVCVGCKVEFESVEKVSMCLLCFEAYLADLEQNHRDN